MERVIREVARLAEERVAEEQRPAEAERAAAAARAREELATVEEAAALAQLRRRSRGDSGEGGCCEGSRGRSRAQARGAPPRTGKGRRGRTVNDVRLCDPP